MGDLTMLRKELAAGFLIAGFISVHVPASWWSNVFFSSSSMTGIANRWSNGMLKKPWI